MALAEHLYLPAAVRAENIAHVLDQSEHGDVHHLCHVESLFDYHCDKILRGRDDNYSVDGQALENGQRHIARSGRHIDKHIVDIAPNDLRPELLNNSGNNRSAPDDRRILFFEQEVN